MKQITCEGCVNWLSRDGIYGVCLLANICSPGNATCEYAKEDEDNETN